jgi:type I restriction enzyme S subunit
MNQRQNIQALGELAELVMGQAPSSKDTNFNQQGTPFVKVGEFGTSRPVFREWTTKPLRMARSTDVLLCVVGTCGKINLGADCAIGRSVAAIRPNPNKLDQFYLYYFMMTLVERLRRGSQGAAQTVISKDMIERVQLPVPSLSEQQQIVRLLDEAFEGIAVAKANAEKNLQSTRTLFESQVQSVLSLGGERWEMKNVGEVCSFKRGLTYAKTDEVALSENVVLRATNIDLATNHLVYGELKYISDAVVVPEDKKVKKDSLIICMASGSKSHLGKVAIIEEDSGYAFGGFMGMLTPSVGLLPKYLFYLMTSGLYRTFIKSISDGANINNLTFDKLSSFSFPVPPLSEQKGIVAELDALEVSTGRLAATYAAKLRAIDALQASILSQAFSGNRKAA